jgi:hypothetical protein
MIAFTFSSGIGRIAWAIFSPDCAPSSFGLKPFATSPRA